MGVSRIATGKNLFRGGLLFVGLFFVSDFFLFSPRLFASFSIFGFKGLHTQQVY